MFQRQFGFSFVCNPSIHHLVIPVALFLSSQCVTLGSRYKHICKLYNRKRTIGTYIKNNVHDENKMDPSVTHWDDKEKCWDDKEKSTGMTGKKILDPSVTHWDDKKKKHCGERKKRHCDDIRVCSWETLIISYLPKGIGYQTYGNLVVSL